MDDSHQSRSFGVGSPFWQLCWRSIVLVLGIWRLVTRWERGVHGGRWITADLDGLSLRTLNR